METDYTVTIPADVECEDRVLANLTARQLAILIPAGMLVWIAYLGLGKLVPLPVFAAVAIPFLGAATALALVERDGIALHRLARHAIAQAIAPRRLVIARGEVPALPQWVTADLHDRPLPAPLRLPVRAIRGDGAINLGAEGVAVIVACSTVSFALRTPEEQAGLVEAFAGWLNSLTGPTQILIRAQPINLTPAIHALGERAPTLPHPALEAAARDHARFLSGLAATRELFARQVLIVLREPHTTTATGVNRPGHRDDVDASAMRALRRAEQTVRALGSAGINAHLLDGAYAGAVLAACADPTAPPMDHDRATSDEPVTATTQSEGER
jgi:hypothetical protein